MTVKITVIEKHRFCDFAHIKSTLNHVKETSQTVSGC